MHQYSFESHWQPWVCSWTCYQPFLWPPIMSLHPSGEVIPEKSIFLQLQNVQTVTGKKKKLSGLLIVNSLVFERGARP